MIAAAFAALVALALPTVIVAQHGTPFNLRSIAPTIHDADPGTVPVAADLYDRVPVGTKVIVQQ
jgi:hypothetical protein